MTSMTLPGRTLVTATGADALGLLQRLTSNDLSPLETGEGGIYTLLLTPQGRYLHDFFVFRSGGDLYLDVPAAQVEALVVTLRKYNLRGDAVFAVVPGMYARLSDAPAGLAFRDPRHTELGWRCWSDEVATNDDAYQVRRIGLGLVEPSTDMKPGTSLPLEFGLESLNAISFSKGCYTGQEMTARMQNRGLAKHRLVAGTPGDEGVMIAEAGGVALLQIRKI